MSRPYGSSSYSASGRATGSGAYSATAGGTTNPMDIPTATSAAAAATPRTIGFHPTTRAPTARSPHSPHSPHRVTQSIPINIPPASLDHGPSMSSGGLKAVKLDLMGPSAGGAPIPVSRQPVYGFAPRVTASPSTSSVATAYMSAPMSVMTAASSSSNGSSSTFHSAAAAASSSGTPPSAVASSPQPYAPPPFASRDVGPSAYSPPVGSSATMARSAPLSIPAFRRAISFVGLDKGFDLFAPELDTIDAMQQQQQQQQPMASKQSVAPRIQNFSQLGQQLRQHLQQQQQQGANASAAPVPTMQKSSSTVSMLDADGLPDISSPPPTSRLHFAFDSSESPSDLVDTGSAPSAAPMLNFDAVQVNSQDQVLGAIPQMTVRTHTPPQTVAGGFPHSPIAQLPAPSSGWTQLSSSAPSQMPSFGGRSHRDSNGHSVASAAALARRTALSFAQYRRADDVHTPTTIASEDAGGAGGGPIGVPEQEWSDDDGMDDAALDDAISHVVHGDASSCSLSSCSSCSAESSDFSANLEDDFDVTLTFAPRPEDEVDQAITKRLNQAKREHHTRRHLHHRRIKARILLKQQREEARMQAAMAAASEQLHHAESDDVRSSHLNEEDLITVGSYTHAERQRKISRYLEKRRRRVWSKKILYSCRKNFAGTSSAVCTGKSARLARCPVAAHPKLTTVAFLSMPPLCQTIVLASAAGS